MEELENEISTQVEENTVSLASAQALADALAKIEVYTPTTWVDNSSPDIDAEHLNKPEQAIKRVTDALNSAVDVIKDLQSQVTKNSGAISDVNNNLSNSLQYVHTAKNPFDFNDVNTPAGFHRINESDSFKNPPLEIQNNANINYGNIFVCKSNENSDTLSMTFYPYDQNTIFIKTANFASWEGKGWTQLVSKSDLWPQNSGTKITANTDMHTITTTGHYYCQGNNIAATLKNCPCTVAFTLTVYRGAGGSTDGMYIIQEYTTYLGDARIIQVYNEDSKNWTVHRISFSS